MSHILNNCINKHNSKKCGFTLVEIVVVVVVLGVLAGIGIPRFSESRKSHYYEQAQAALRSIHVQNDLLFRKSGSYYPAAGTVDIDAINTTLALSVNENIAVYSCSSAGNGYTCSASVKLPGEASNSWILNQTMLRQGINPFYNDYVVFTVPECSVGICHGGSDAGYLCVQDLDCSP